MRFELPLFLSPLQGSDMIGLGSQGVALGYHLSGFQPLGNGEIGTSRPTSEGVGFSRFTNKTEDISAGSV